MKKLSHKFIISVSAVLVAVIAATLFLNNHFIERYYVYQKKQEIRAVCQTLADSGGNYDAVRQDVERENRAVIVRVPNTSDNDAINEALQEAFLDKGLGLEAYWLWDQDYERAMEKGGQLRIYAQPTLNYSLLVGYTGMGDDFLAVAMIIPNVGEMLSLINWMTAAVFGGAVLILVILISFLVKRITKPLGRLEAAADRIAEQDFCRVEVDTGDELERLADSINSMSGRLSDSQSELQQKNRQMEALLNNVSHDLKTPISLIKAYGAGIRDGLDDGTFLDTVIGQADRMEMMTGRLLKLSGLERSEVSTEVIDLAAVVEKIMEPMVLQAHARNLEFFKEMPVSVTINGNPEAVETLVENLLGNAVKYGAGQEILVKLSEASGRPVLSVENMLDVDGTLDLERIWEPFYVGEASRSKELSGTGLGLSMVRAVAQRYGYLYEAGIADGAICFTITF